MNKQFIISVVVVFIWIMLAGFLVHAMLLAPDYAALPDLYRGEAEAQKLFPYLVLGHLSMAIGITWVYRMGKQDKPWLQQGIRFGIVLVLLMTLSTYLIYFAVLQMPDSLVHKQIIFDTVAVILTGIVTAFVNK